MSTISENLQTIKSSTDAIKQAIIDKGGTISGDITTWANAISGISGGSDNEMIDVYWSADNNSFKVSFVAPSYGRIIIAYYDDMGESTSYAWADAGQNTNLSINARITGPKPFIEAAMYYGEMSQKVTICNLIQQ